MTRLLRKPTTMLHKGLDHVVCIGHPEMTRLLCGAHADEDKAVWKHSLSSGTQGDLTALWSWRQKQIYGHLGVIRLL